MINLLQNLHLKIFHFRIYSIHIRFHKLHYKLGQVWWKESINPSFLKKTHFFKINLLSKGNKNCNLESAHDNLFHKSQKKFGLFPSPCTSLFHNIRMCYNFTCSKVAVDCYIIQMIGGGIYRKLYSSLFKKNFKHDPILKGDSSYQKF